MVVGGGSTTSFLHHGDITMDRNDENKIAYGSYGDYDFGIHYSIDNGQIFNGSTPVHPDIRSLDMVSNIGIGV